MSSPSVPDRSSGSKRHSRNVSIRARSSTKGPLDLDDSLASDPLQSTDDDPLSANASSSLVQNTPSSPRKVQVAPDSPLISSSIPLSPQRSKDLSFLLHPSIYHALPSALHQDPVGQLLQSVTVESISSLLSSQNYRAAAEFCARRLCHAPAPSQNEIFYLFYIRLASLTLLNYTSLAAQESKALEDISGPFYRSDSSVTKAANASTPEEFGSGEAGSILPWELQVLWARLTGVAHGDVRKSISTYFDLAQHARRAYRACGTGDSAQKGMWRSRLRELGLAVASSLVEAGDLEGAARHLEGLRVSGTKGQFSRDSSSAGRDANASALLASRTALVHLALGDVDAATKCLKNDPTLSSPPSPTDPSALLPSMIAIVEGRYTDAVNQLHALLKKSSSSSSHHQTDSSTSIILHNLAVCLFYTGHVDQTIRILESLINGSAHQPPLDWSFILSSGHGSRSEDEEKKLADAADEDAGATAADSSESNAANLSARARSFHALTFNLATCFELTSERAAAQKAALAERVMDQLRESGSRAERSAGADFKL